MILAMVFMLFCLFVGGSVLAAASENGYRVEHLSDQQQYLNERSAAALICDQLKTEDSKPLRLTIHEIESTIQYVTIADGGVVVPYGEVFTNESVTIQIPANLNLTSLQRIALETAVWRYMKQAGMNQYDTGRISLSNFPAAAVDDFWCQFDLVGLNSENSSDPAEGSNPTSGADEICGTIRVEGSGNASRIRPFDVTFACGSGENLYDFTVDFGEYSQMNVVMNGYSGTKDTVTTTAITTYNGKYAQITTQSTQTAISWENPVIEKGGA